MTDQEIAIAANSIAGLAEVSGEDVNFILECLSGNVLSEEDCGRIKERFVF